jgi:hypothetical protein
LHRALASVFAAAQEHQRHETACGGQHGPILRCSEHRSMVSRQSHSGQRFACTIFRIMQPGAPARRGRCASGARLGSSGPVRPDPAQIDAEEGTGESGAEKECGRRRLGEMRKWRERRAQLSRLAWVSRPLRNWLCCCWRNLPSRIGLFAFFLFGNGALGLQRGLDEFFLYEMGMQRNERR